MKGRSKRNSTILSCNSRLRTVHHVTEHVLLDGFALVGEDEKAGLLKRYWTVPDRQIETSVVLADARWFGGR